MKINSIFQFFVPKDKKFFPLFEQATSNLILMATSLHDVVNLPASKRNDLFQKIEELEQMGEDIAREINLELSSNFITPFDREDIYSLVKSIDYVADNLNGAANRINIYQVDKITKSIRKITAVNLEACQLIGEGIDQLKDFKDLNRVYEICERINKLENKSDRIFDKAVQEIFENETDAKNIIKYKEVLSSLESATDKCKSVANVLEAVAVKYS